VRRTRWILALLALTVLLVACSKTAPQNTMNPQGPTAQTEKNLLVLVLWPAAAVFLVDERTTIYKYGASDQRHLKTRPNHALFWEAITDACARGHRRFDFGRSDFGGEGLRRFKSSWGAQELELDYTTIGPAPEPHEGGGRLSALAAAVIRRSPSFVCRGAGLFYRFSA